MPRRASGDCSPTAQVSIGCADLASPSALEDHDHQRQCLSKPLRALLLRCFERNLMIPAVWYNLKPQIRPRNLGTHFDPGIRIAGGRWGLEVDSRCDEAQALTKC